MNLAALQTAGQAVKDSRPALQPFADELRRQLDPRYARMREIHDDIAAGIRDIDGSSLETAVRREARGRGAVPRHQCWNCHLVGTVRSRFGCCSKCGYSHGRDNHEAVTVS